MKIVFFTRSLTLGGAQTQLVLLAKELAKRGHDVKVFLFYREGQLLDALNDSGVEVVSLNKESRWDLLPFFFRLVKEVKAFRPDVFNSYLTTSNIFAAVLKWFVPSIKVVWGIRASKVDTREYNFATRMSWYCEARLAKVADLIIVNSESGRCHIVALGFPKNKVRVIFNGINIDRFRPNPDYRNQTRKNLGIQGDEVLVGLVASLEPIKNHELFLETCAHLSRKSEKLRFTCIGNGDQSRRGVLMKQASDLGIADKMIWLVGRPDVHEFYPALDIFCLTSKSEGFPNVICEAMASGVMCVSTDVGDAKFIIGGTGSVVGQHDPKILAEEILALLSRSGSNQPRTRSRIEECFSIERLTSKTEDEFYKIAKR